MHPTISVVVPTYNRSQLLPRAIDSILQQTFEDFEIIVVDDGSKDDTTLVLERFGDPRLRFVRQEHAGSNPARNLGARLSSGQLLAFLDSDDEAAPRWLERLAQPFGDPRVGIAFCGAQTYADSGSLLEVRNPIPMGPMWNHWTCVFNDGTFLLRREIFEAIGGYAEDLRSSQHSELGFRVVDYCAEHDLLPAQIAEPLVRYHAHSGPRIRTDPEAVLDGTEFILNHYPERLRRYPRDYYDFLSVAGAQAARLGRFGLARSYFWRAIKHLPFETKSYLRWLAVSLRGITSRSKH